MIEHFGLLGRFFIGGRTPSAMIILMYQTEPGNQISLTFDQGTLLLTGLAADQLPKITDSYIWNWDTRVGAWRCKAIHYNAVRKVLSEQLGKSFSDNVMVPVTVAFTKTDIPIPRPEQVSPFLTRRSAANLTRHGSSMGKRWRAISKTSLNDSDGGHIRLSL